MDNVDSETKSEDSETYLEYTLSPNSGPRRKSSGSDERDDWKNNSEKSLPSFDLKRNLENKKYEEKIKKIQSILSKKPIDFESLRKLAISDGGLVSDEIRKTAWPFLLELSVNEEPESLDEEELKSHPEYQQVVLDVNRSLRRFPPWVPIEKRMALLNQLTVLILRVVKAHPRLQYYQGYHDVAFTLLLVTGIDAAFVILEKLSNNHLKDCMEPTMEKTSHLLNYIYPLVKQLNQSVYEHLEKSGVGNMFALPWFLTWFGHNLNHYDDVVRLFDYFLASETLAPLYLSAVIINFRAKEILETPCDMASLHSLLSEIPDDLPFDELLNKTTELYQKYPPELIEKEALSRTRREEEQRKKDYKIRRYRMNQSLPFIWRMVGKVDPDRRLPIWAFIPQDTPTRVRRSFLRYRYLVATATFAVGLYAVFLKAVEASR